MKRHLIIATAAAAALVAGGTVTAVAVSNDAGSAHAGSAHAASGGQLPAKTVAHDAPAQTSGTARVQDGRSSIPMQDDDANGQEEIREANAAKVSAPDAAAAALKAVPGTVTGLDLDADRPGLVWDADVLGKDGKWHEITLDAGNARVLNQHVDHDEGDAAQERAAAENARTDASAAARAAASHGTVTSVELDDDHGTKAVWEAETVTKDGKEHKLLIDTQSGNATAAPAHDSDDDNDNDNDGADD
ncbi:MULTISPECIES: PepSY domain-containing protein [unclassified Streptomyces]|uniref:PepSY domain-containing protein n=1 Tax=unclassified Streptomyces TaxID=2593676 RepID=UPI00089256EA|nr:MULTISPECIES: PepSY domain-containing protein [unclassified Streptomyces]PBC85111.1 peptidase YpeB-like protein [Streptomyces sp. 2321.6]SDR21838.1 Peptidase propeptide and YPEB domain-containing protein [Streptomyces sp. KS_16]SED56215.1 Peptidase propeptide and YPEB domain-containing protein [Streptomyces sp. 2133.1]SEE28564.1 Peptidase propeptide and YPEB domain-containing protein [Streptomyces sp. 2112.3]SNC71134.1 Peptidase propeptide and YPEB domain-containing protein [Streptomyces sp